MGLADGLGHGGLSASRRSPRTRLASGAAGLWCGPEAARGGRHHGRGPREEKRMPLHALATLASQPPIDPVETTPQYVLNCPNPWRRFADTTLYPCRVEE